MGISLVTARKSDGAAPEASARFDRRALQQNASPATSPVLLKARHLGYRVHAIGSPVATNQKVISSATVLRIVKVGRANALVVVLEILHEKRIALRKLLIAHPKDDDRNRLGREELHAARSQSAVPTVLTEERNRACGEAALSEGWRCPGRTIR